MSRVARVLRIQETPRAFRNNLHTLSNPAVSRLRELTQGVKRAFIKKKTAPAHAMLGLFPFPVTSAS